MMPSVVCLLLIPRCIVIGAFSVEATRQAVSLTVPDAAARTGTCASVMTFNVISPVDVDDTMSAAETIRCILDAFRPDGDEDDWQFSNTQAEVAGSAYRGCRALMSLSAKMDAKLDVLGRLQPGAFERPTLLERYLLEHADYRTLATLSEWKALAPPEERELLGDGGQRSVAQQRLLIRQEQCNWEEACINLERRETPWGMRWLVVNIYKDYHDPAGTSIYKGSSDDNADPEEARNC